MPQDRLEVQGLFRSGVKAIGSVTEHFGEQEWGQPACGAWTARQTAVHLLGVANWYHEWLDRAIQGEQTLPFPESEIDARAERDVQRFPDLTGSNAVGRFQERAEEYLERTTAEWDRTYRYPFGVVTTGLHCGLAASEWHLHAWDLAMSASAAYEPPDPRALFVAAGSGVAAAKGGLGGAVLKRVVPLASRRSPWKTMLEQSGRKAPKVS